MSRTFITVGVDVGQLQDPTAISVVAWRPDPADGTRRIAQVRHLERLPLRTTYPDVARRIDSLLINLTNVVYPATPELIVLVDVTGIGRATFDMIQEVLPRSVRCIAVTLTAGANQERKGREWHVPKMDLIAALNRFMAERRLEIIASDEARAFQQELRTFVGTKTGAATVETGARSGAHDDLVISVGLALLPDQTHRRPSHQRNALWTHGMASRRIPIRRAYGGAIYADPATGDLEWR
jgi:hypothetical protein